MHVHVTCPDGEAKFWLEPEVFLCQFYGLSHSQLKVLEKLVKERKNEIAKAWKKHFQS